ncbi:MAG: protein-L-isoaspartate(D-aspartate) O-methyltransferase [Candidatus Azotimanducaceae bacterium]|jgi:protein-L-isoaspartate(D-aspartate) O-methyltransferase
MEDSFRHQGLRRQLVQLLREKDIVHEGVLFAIGKIPRHLFLDKAFLEYAYQNKAFPIGADQTISHPYTVAFQSELLDIKPGEKVLEIGTGSGYQTCVLLEMGAKVYTIERQKELFSSTKRLLPKLGYFAKVKYGDGYQGWPEFAPFDKVIVTAGAPYIPEALMEQLKIGGLLVIPVGSGAEQIMTAIVRLSETDFEKIEYDTFSFVPLLENKAR